jgi:hypothetical protein
MDLEDFAVEFPDHFGIVKSTIEERPVRSADNDTNTKEADDHIPQRGEGIEGMPIRSEKQQRDVDRRREKAVQDRQLSRRVAPAARTCQSRVGIDHWMN